VKRHTSNHTIVSLVILLLLATPALAQRSTFALDEDGWEQTHAPEPGTDEYDLAEARRLIAQGHPGRAKKRLDRWIDRNKRTDNPWLATAYLLRGDARDADGNEYLALFDYERVIQGFSFSPDFLIAVERELNIAIRYAHGLKRKTWWSPFRVGSTGSLSTELLIRVQERMPGSELGERSMIELADYYYDHRQMKLAAVAYELLLVNYPQSRYRKKAALRRILANLGQYKGPRHNGAPLVESRTLIQNYRDRYPLEATEAGLSDALLARIDESAAAQILVTAQWYLKRNDPVSARFSLRRLVHKHPRTVAATRARELMNEHNWTKPSDAAPPPEILGPQPQDAPQDTPDANSESDSAPATDDAPPGAGP